MRGDEDTFATLVTLGCLACAGLFDCLAVLHRQVTTYPHAVDARRWRKRRLIRRGCGNRSRVKNNDIRISTHCYPPLVRESRRKRIQSLCRIEAETRDRIT